MGSLAGGLSQRWKKQAFLVLSGSAVFVWSQRQSRVLQNDGAGSSRRSMDGKSENNENHDPDERKSKPHVALFEDDGSTTRNPRSEKSWDASPSLSENRWPSIRDAIASKVLPDWVTVLPGYIAKLRSEMEIHPTSLANEIWQEAQDPYIHPEITNEPRVRIGKGLCKEELDFIQRRKRYTTLALARFLEIPEDEIDPKDVPTIAICGSGGGLRALVAGASSCLSAQQSGLFDCAMYTAGVSGSCWLQTLYNSSLSSHRFDKVVEHLKSRISTHIAYPPAFLELLTRAPTNKYILSSPIEKLRGDPVADFGIVDIYGILLATRLMIPRDELSVDDRDLRLSNQRRFLEQGENPMPIYTAVRHEIPIEEVKRSGNATNDALDGVTAEAKKKARFQWFEMTPYELGCEELEAAIPSWSIGRHFNRGESTLTNDGIGLPELRVPFLMGIWGSAFCATLAHYYKEIRPLVKELAGFGGVDGLIKGKMDDLTKLHPIDPGQVPNYALGLKGILPASCPASIFKAPYLNLMDAGMSNNLPIYPLLRKSRDVDIIVCFDASADIEQENWLSRVDGYAKQQGIIGWPMGAGWPKREVDSQSTGGEHDITDTAPAAQSLANNIKTREALMSGQDHSKRPSDLASGRKVNEQVESVLGFCNVWVGDAAPRITDDNTPNITRLGPDEEWRLLEPLSGMTVVYLPFLPNAKVEGVDPSTTPFMSTWNFVYTADEIDKVVALARANFEEGREQMKKVVKAVYQRKKARRLYLEERDEIEKWRLQLRSHGDHFS